MKAGEETRLCDKCGTRPATNFICRGGPGRTDALCDECLRVEDSIIGKLAASLAVEAKSARCCYCGGFPCSGGLDTFSQITAGPPQDRWMCMSCSMEYYSSLQKAIELEPGTLTAEEQITRLKEIGTEIDSHMASFVARRDN